MARFSLAALAALDRSAVKRLWMTTRDAARKLRVHRNTVRWFVAEGVLWGERTVSGQWLFRQDVVDALMQARAQASLRRRPAVLRAAHLRLVHGRTEPRQLELFTARGGVTTAAAGRKGTVHSHSETSPFPRELGRGLIRTALSPGEGPKRMAKVEEPHGRDIRRAGGRRR